MRLSIIVVLLLLIASLALVGCDDSDDPTPTPDETASVTPTPEITETPSPQPTPAVTDIPPQKGELALASGQIFSYSMSTDAGEYGRSRYEVTAVEARADATVYTVQANLEMAASCPTTPTTGTATLRLDQFGALVSYVEEFSVGQG